MAVGESVGTGLEVVVAVKAGKGVTVAVKVAAGADVVASGVAVLSCSRGLAQPVDKRTASQTSP